MKKILLLSAMVGGMVTGAQAQQLPNNDFDQVWEDCKPYTGKDQKTDVRGVQPTGWKISNVYGLSGIGLGGTIVGDTIVNESTIGKAVKLTNTPNPIVATQIVPAYLTLGTTWNTSVMGSQNDGGTFGGIQFTNKPDAVEFYYQRTDTTGVPASVIAYLWKGEWQQADVPVNIASFGAPTTEQMINRDRNILAMATDKGGAVTKNDSALLIASVCDSIVDTTQVWTKKVVDINYHDTEAQPENLNLIFAAGDYFNAARIMPGAQLCVDSVKLVYYHALTSFTYDGITKNIAEDQTEIDFSNTTYDANKTLSYIKKGVGATVVKSYNEADATLTIEVQGNDYSSNPNSKTTYTVKFAKPVPTTGKLSSLVVNGSEVLKANQFYYTVYGEYNAQSIQWTAEDGDLAKVTSNYDENSRTATVSVNAGQNTNTYFVKFAKKGTSYTSSVMIAMGPIFLGAPVQAVEITPLTPYNTVDLQLMNFSIDGGNTIVGNIFVENVPYQKLPNGDVQLNTTIKDFKIFGDAAQKINPAIKSLTLNGVLSNNDLAATITIDLNGTPILVKVASTSSKYVDATGIPGFNFSLVRTALTNPNALIYADAGATNAAANDVVAGTCAELKLTDGHPFNAPVAFKATAVNYNRAFNTTANYVSSFVLPFAMDKAKVDGKVYQFAGVEGDYVNFTEVTEGQLDANTPYLIEATTANPFNQATDVQVAVTPATMQVANGDYAHVGTYTTQAVKSEGNTSYYGYAEGAFVKANTGTLNPFRTMIKTTVANAQAQFSLKLGNEVTGIIGVNSELGKVDVYNLEGKLIRNQVEATTALQGLAKGVYVINGKKVIK